MLMEILGGGGLIGRPYGSEARKFWVEREVSCEYGFFFMSLVWFERCICIYILGMAF